MTVNCHVIMLGQGITYFVQLHLLIFKCEQRISTWLSSLLSLYTPVTLTHDHTGAPTVT